MRSDGERDAHLNSAARAGIFALLLAPTFVFAQPPSVGDASVPLELQLEAPLQNERPAHEPVTYAFRADPDATYLVEVEQHGLDFMLTVHGPDGIAHTYNTPSKRDGREVVLLEGTAAGTHHVTVISKEPTDARGRYELRLSRINSGTADARFLDAVRTMTEGANAYADGSRAGAQQALRLYLAAAALWHEIGATRNESHALYCAAMLEYWVEYDWARAAELASAVADLFGSLQETKQRSNAMLLQAMALIEAINEQGADDANVDFTKAVALLEDSASLVEPLGDSYELARRAYFLGLANNNVGELDEARKAWERAAVLFDEAGEWLEALYVGFNVAVASIQEGRNGEAIASLQSILDEPRHAADPHFRASVLDSLAAAHRRVGNIDEALRMYSAALEMHRTLEDHHGEAGSLNGVANTYFAAGQLALASEYAQQARQVADVAGEGNISAASRTTLGNVAFLTSEYAAALEFHEAALSTTSSRLLRAQRTVLVARDLTALGRHGEAQERSAAALELAEEAESPLAIADARHQLGMSSLADGDFPAAAESLEQALQQYSSLGLRGAQADAHHGLALVSRELGDLNAALRHGEASLDHVAALREKVSAPELRALYGAARRSYYETQIELLMDKHAEEDAGAAAESLKAAFNVSERARARFTIDLLAEASVDLQKETDPKLAEQKRRLSTELAAMRLRQDSLLNSDSFPTQRDELSTLLQQMASVETSLNLLETELRARNPRYASLTTPNTLGADAIQRLLDPDSVLLQFSLGQDRSFVWIVTSNTIRGVELADRGTVETAARKAYASLSAAPAQASRREALSELARHVLHPIVEYLAGKRLLVVADGALQYIPFAVLPLPANEGRQPLIVDHEVVSLPSASVLAMQRLREDRRAPRKTLAVFADPVFERTDPRFAASNTQPSSSLPHASSRSEARPLLSCARCILRGGARLERLPATGFEARAIAELVPAEERLLQSGFEVTLANVLAQPLDEYRIVHFATHGLVDSEYPALSALALSSFDSAGQPQDGFLRLGDIYNMKLSADLVVLSACETALGEAIRGEGLIGLTQGFMYAGAKSLVGSLWQVPDGATAALMIRFYELMFRHGQRPAEALRNAQLAVSAEQRWNDPFYWGAFTVMGEWQ